MTFDGRPVPPRGADRRPRSRRVAGHALRTEGGVMACQCGRAGPWSLADYSRREVRALHAAHKRRLPPAP